MDLPAGLASLVGRLRVALLAHRKEENTRKQLITKEIAILHNGLISE